MYTKLSIRTHTAIKEHKCELCFKFITIGQLYYKEVGLDDGNFQSISLHFECESICDDYRMESYIDDVYTFQDIYEAAIAAGRLKD